MQYRYELTVTANLVQGEMTFTQSCEDQQSAEEFIWRCAEFPGTTSLVITMTIRQ